MTSPKNPHITMKSSSSDISKHILFTKQIHLTNPSSSKITKQILLFWYHQTYPILWYHLTNPLLLLSPNKSSSLISPNKSSPSHITKQIHLFSYHQTYPLLWYHQTNPLLLISPNKLCPPIKSSTFVNIAKTIHLKSRFGAV